MHPYLLMLLVAAAHMATTVPAWAAEAGPVASPVEAAFGATVVSTYPDGRIGRLWLQRDGGYTGESRRGNLSSGRWSVKDDRLCLKQSRPFPTPFSYCTPLPADGGRGAWPARAVTGEPIQVRIVRDGSVAQAPGAR